MRPRPRKREQIEQRLREAIPAMSPGERLPSVADLERQFGVSSGTVMAALANLRQEGLVVARRRSGIYVADTTSLAARDGIAGHPQSAGNVSSPVSGTVPTVAALAVHRSPFYSHCIDCLAAGAADSGMGMVCRYDEGEMALQDALALEALSPLGFMVFHMDLEPVAEALLARGHRVVLLGDPPLDSLPPVPCVFGEPEQGGYLATHRLLSLGHRRVGYVHGSRGDRLFRSRRWQGHRRALREAGLPEEQPLIGPDLIANWRDNSEAAAQFFMEDPGLTAAAAWSDSNAAELIALLRHAGVRVPEDVSVIGYDNLPLGESHQPPLDTVDQHLDVQIRQALSILTSTRYEDRPVTTIVVPSLLCRASSARPRAIGNSAAAA